MAGSFALIAAFCILELCGWTRRAPRVVVFRRREMACRASTALAVRDICVFNCHITPRSALLLLLTRCLAFVFLELASRARRASLLLVFLRRESASRARAALAVRNISVLNCHIMPRSAIFWLLALCLTLDLLELASRAWRATL